MKFQVINKALKDTLKLVLPNIITIKVLNNTLEILVINDTEKILMKLESFTWGLGQVRIYSKEIYEIIKNLEDKDTIEFEITEDNFFIRSNYFETSIKIYDFIPSTTEEVMDYNIIQEFKVSYNSLKEVIERVKVSIGEEELCNNVLIEFEDDKISLITTDKICLTKASTYLNNDLKLSYRISKNIIEIISKIKNDIKILITNKNIVFKINTDYGEIIIENLIENNKFFDYREIIPYDCMVSFRVKSDNLLNSIKKINKCITEKTKKIILELDGDYLNLEGIDEEKLIKDRIWVENLKKQNGKIKIYSKYLEKILSRIKNEGVDISFNENSGTFKLETHNLLFLLAALKE